MIVELQLIHPSSLNLVLTMPMITKAAQTKTVSKLVIAELRAELAARGLSSKGSKSELVARLQRAAANQSAAAATEKPQSPRQRPAGGIHDLFMTYAALDDESADEIGVNGLLKLADDLNVNMETDVAMLVMCWKLGVKQAGQISSAEFMQLAGLYYVTDLNTLKAKLPHLRSRIKKEHDLAAIYRYAWSFTEPDAKSMELEEAIALWQMLLGQFKHFGALQRCASLHTAHRGREHKKLA